jgi:hypothetical protein
MFFSVEVNVGVVVAVVHLHRRPDSWRERAGAG